MSKVSVFFLLFVVLEFAVLFKLAGLVGVLPLLLWLILMVVVGVRLITSSFQRMRQALAENSFVLAPLQLNYVVAGCLLIFPGVVSDVLAVLLILVPGLRSFTFNKMSHTSMAQRSTFKTFFYQDFQNFNGTGTNGTAEGPSETHTSPYNDPTNPYGQPNRPEQPKSDLQKAKEHFQSKRPVIDADYESVPDDEPSDAKDSNVDKSK